MRLIPKNLKPGAHKIGEAPKNWDSVYARISDDFARYAFLVGLKKQSYFIVDGKPDPRFSGWLDEFDFSSDGLGYCYERGTKSGPRSVVNGFKHPDPHASNFCFHGSGGHWTYRKKMGYWTKLVSSTGIDHPHALGCYECFTPNRKHVIYTAYDNEFMEPNLPRVGKNKGHFVNGIVCDDHLIFKGGISEAVMDTDRFPFASWLAYEKIPGENDERERVYLLGKKRELLPPYSEVLTFTVSPNHQHYFYGAADEEVKDRHNNFCGEQFVVFDGKRQRHKWMEVGWAENTFSPNSKRWTYTAIDQSEREHLVLDGKRIWDADRFSGNQFSPKLNRHGFVAYNGLPKKLLKKAGRWARVRGPARVIIDGRIHDPKQCVVDFSLSFSPDGRHFSFIGHDLEKRTRKSVNFRVYLDGRPVGEGDLCFGTQAWYEGGARFSSDSRRLYYFSIIDRLLFFNVIEVK